MLPCTLALRQSSQILTELQQIKKSHIGFNLPCLPPPLSRGGNNGGYFNCRNIAGVYLPIPKEISDFISSDNFEKLSKILRLSMSTSITLCLSVSKKHLFSFLYGGGGSSMMTWFLMACWASTLDFFIFFFKANFFHACVDIASPIHWLFKPFQEKTQDRNTWKRIWRWAPLLRNLREKFCRPENKSLITKLYFNFNAHIIFKRPGEPHRLCL